MNEQRVYYRQRGLAYYYIVLTNIQKALSGKQHENTSAGAWIMASIALCGPHPLTAAPC